MAHRQLSSYQSGIGKPHKEFKIRMTPGAFGREIRNAFLYADFEWLEPAEPMQFKTARSNVRLRYKNACK